MTLQMKSRIVLETDPVRYGTCIECFSSKKDQYFYDSSGPFCNKTCYANYHGLIVDKLPPIFDTKRYVKGETHQTR